jgi:hypothetical protein
MLTALTRSPSVPAASPASNERVAVRQICFVTDAPAGAKILRRFRQPRQAVAVESALKLSDVHIAEVGSEPIDRCSIVFLPREGDGKGLSYVRGWMACPKGEAARVVVVHHNDEIIHWRPGQALAQCTRVRQPEILASLADFTFYEGALRALEAGLEAHEAEAQADVSIAYRIRERDQEHWRRFTEAIEYFAQMRLTYARLEPQLVNVSRTLPPDSQRLVSALLRKADVEDRLEALNDRLEVLEDLYEGANDRVADYRGYRTGALLEIIITVLLFVETIIIALDVYARYR